MRTAIAVKKSVGMMIMTMIIVMVIIILKNRGDG